jgi:hypothetical protein
MSVPKLVHKLDPKLGPAAPPAVAPAPPPVAGGGGGVSPSAVPLPPPPFTSGSAPDLPPADMNMFNLDTILMWVSSSNTGMSNQQSHASRENIKTLNFANEAMQKKVQELIDSAAKAAKDAQDAAEKNKIINWVITGAVALGAIGVTLMTGGAGIAVGLTAVLGAAQIATMVMQQLDIKVPSPADGEGQSLDLSPGGAVNAAIDAAIGAGLIVETHEVDGKVVDSKGNEITEAYKAAHPKALIIDSASLSAVRIVLGIAASLIVQGGIGKLAANSLAKSAKAAGSAEDMQALLRSAGAKERLGQVLGVTGGMLQGSSTVASGIVSLKGAEAELSKDQSNTEKDYTESQQQLVTQKRKRMIDVQTHFMQNAIDVMRQVSASLASEAAVNEDVARINVG